MEKFTVLTGVAAPIPMPNISTDLIAPSHFPGKKPEEAIVMSFKDKLFANLRYFPDGTPKTDFVLGDARYQGAKILLTGENFGCGSSRETAVWSLQEAGIACVIAPSFGDIFHDNSFQNGLLPLRVPMEDIERLTKGLARTNASELTVDLEKRELRVSGMEPVTFDLPDNRRLPLMQGLDQLGFMLRSVDDIADYENRANAERPWAFASALG